MSRRTVLVVFLLKDEKKGSKLSRMLPIYVGGDVLINDVHEPRRGEHSNSIYLHSTVLKLIDTTQVSHDSINTSKIPFSMLQPF